MPISRTWLGALVVVLLVGMGYDRLVADVARAAPSPPLVHAIQTAASDHQFAQRDVDQNTQPSERDAPLPTALHAAVLLQAKDCTGNLRMLHLLHRRAVRRSIQLSVIWFVGAPNDSVAIRSLLPGWTRRTPLHVAPLSVVQALAQLGHTSTPSLVVLDQDRRVRFVTQSPRSSREVAGLRRIIEGLTWLEDF